MENLEVDFPKVYAGEKFKLQAKIRNTGSVDAWYVIPKLYNIDASASGQSFEITCSKDCTQCMNLLAPDPERGTTGESKICIWDCTAPRSIPKGMTLTFNPSVRLYYAYRTTTTKALMIASQDELRAIQNQGKALPSETVSTTTSPVQMDVVVNGPIRYWEGEKKLRFPININIANTGGGTACGNFESKPPSKKPSGSTSSEDSSPAAANPCPSQTGNVADTPQDTTAGIATGCENPSNWNQVAIYFDNAISLEGCDDITQRGYVDLWKGQTKTITCEVVMDVPDVKTGFVQKNLQFTLEYDYFTDASTNVEVIGR